MKPQVGDLRTVTQRFDGEQWVLCLQSMPPRELSDEEILDCLEKSDLPMILLSDFATEKMKVFARAILKKASEK